MPRARMRRTASAISSACARESAGSARRTSVTATMSLSLATFQSFRRSAVWPRVSGVCSIRKDTALAGFGMPGLE